MHPSNPVRPRDESWDIPNLELKGFVCYGNKLGHATLLVSAKVLHNLHVVGNRGMYSPKLHGPILERLKLPYADEEILSGYDEDVSFTRDGCTSWVKVILKLF